GQHENVLNAAGANRRDPKGLLGHEQACAANLPYHVAALDRIQPDLSALDGGRCGFELRKAQGGSTDDHQEGGGVNEPSPVSVSSCVWQGNVHSSRRLLHTPCQDEPNAQVLGYQRLPEVVGT